MDTNITDLVWNPMAPMTDEMAQLFMGILLVLAFFGGIWGAVALVDFWCRELLLRKPEGHTMDRPSVNAPITGAPECGCRKCRDLVKFGGYLCAACDNYGCRRD